MTRIAAVRSAFPAYRYPQAELTMKVAETSGLSPAQRALLARLHGNAGVDYRLAWSRECYRWARA